MDNTAEIDIKGIIQSYMETRNIWVTGKELGITGQKVHFLLNKNGIETPRKGLWSPEDIIQLKALYINGFELGDGKLDEFCKSIGKHKSNVCKKARKLGLKTTRERLHGASSKKLISERSKLRIKIKGHPKGFKGHKRSEESKAKISARSKAMWANKSHKVNSKEYREMLSDRSLKMMNIRMKNNPESIYSRVKHGTITIGDKTFFARSSWEANVAAYFEFLKSKNQIKDWEHEPNTFWFESIKRGVRSYKPDFLITKNDGTQYYEEVKGWMDKKSKTKLKRMKKYYPEIQINILDEKRYKSISKHAGLIPNWGLLK